jgi:hypothetical protein
MWVGIDVQFSKCGKLSLSSWSLQYILDSNWQLWILDWKPCELTCCRFAIGRLSSGRSMSMILTMERQVLKGKSKTQVHDKLILLRFSGQAFAKGLQVTPVLQPVAWAVSFAFCHVRSFSQESCNPFLQLKERGPNSYYKTRLLFSS